MAYGFYAYIDEAGDEGFTFRDPPDRGSSQWFVLSAVMVRESNRNHEMRELKKFISTLSPAHWSKLHFQRLSHDRRAALSYYLSQRPIRTISICWDKREITDDDRDHTLAASSRLHHYAIRYLIERISWLAWHNAQPGAPIASRLVFSKCKNLRYKVIQQYLTHLRNLPNSIRWDAVDTDNLIIKPSSELLGLKAADAVASSIYRGLELNPHGRTEPTYARHLRSVTYNHNGQLIRYGLKIMPRIPEVQPQHDNRYLWISEYQ